MAIPTLATAGGRTFNAGYAGQIADSEPAQIDSFTNTSATAVDFGRVVVRDTNDRSCKVMAADSDQLLGISVRHALQPASTDGNNTVNYPQYQSVPVMRLGVIFVIAAENVRRGDQALALTAGGGTIGGSQGGVAGAGRIDIPGAVWEDTVSSGSVGRLRINTVGTRRTTT
jgi:hypothetical protein